MIRIIPFKAEHLYDIDVQSAQTDIHTWVSPDLARALEREEGWSYSALDGDEVLGCAGLVAQWPGRKTAWAYLSGNVGHRFPVLHRAALKFLNECGVRRVEAAADVNFPEAHRWLAMLGFIKEAERMEAYLPNGSACSLYARVRIER
jgi:hypothetical protein